MKDVNCKCSHLKSEHHKIWYDYTYCNNCQCESFVSSKRPYLSDKLFAIFGVFIIGLGLFVIMNVNLLASYLPQEELDKPYFTFGEFLDIMLPLTTGMILLGCIVVANISFLEYFSLKRRRDFNNQ